MKRRAFLQTSAALAGSVAFEFSLAQARSSVTASPEVTHWVVINPDNTVVIRVARSEMGQGSLTGLVQMVAEELECDLAKTSWEFASPNEHVKRKRIWGSMSTTGSSGIRTSQEYLRKSGAQAREMLVNAAAARWQAPASECVAANGVVAWKDKKLTYGELAGEASKLEPPKDVKLRDPKDWKVIGKSMPRVEIMDKVTGKPIYGATCSCRRCCMRPSPSARFSRAR
jgi:isoquinoline 1-oxidoreductase beta subunit